MGPLDHFPIIETICKHLQLQDLRSMFLVSKKCVECFRLSERIKYRTKILLIIEMIQKMREEISLRDLFK
jgi:hypothetical protein